MSDTSPSDLDTGKKSQAQGERDHMYPIERTDYINAYIGAISDEMRQARIARPKSSDRFRSFDRFYKAVAQLLRSGSTERQVMSSKSTAL